MAPYDWINFEKLLWLLIGGTLLSIVVVLGRMSYSSSFSLRRRTKEEEERSNYEFGEGFEEHNRSTPIFIWLLLVTFAVWSIAYIVFIGEYGL